MNKITVRIIALLVFGSITLQVSACTKTETEVVQSKENVFHINSQKDFEKWSNHKFPPGSKVLFAAGELFTGQFILRGSGTAEFSNLVAAYEPESGKIFTDWIENKPVLQGEGKLSTVLLLKNGAFWEISNLEITNTNGTTEDQGEIHGIKVVAED
uniref:hypothetical protein n=1 Tax=Draconibacterium sp. TaxID=1965318 RepID=UPI00356B2B6C